MAAFPSTKKVCLAAQNSSAEYDIYIYIYTYIYDMIYIYIYILYMMYLPRVLLECMMYLPRVLLEWTCEICESVPRISGFFGYGSSLRILQF